MIPHILIPSRGRPTVKTVLQFSDRMMAKTFIFVSPNEVREYDDSRDSSRKTQYLIVRSEAKEIADKRQEMGEWARGYGIDRFVMMDDDLVFFKHKADDDYHLVRCEPEDMEEMVTEIHWRLHDYCHVSVSSREGNNRFGVGPKPLIIENVRPQRVLAYRTKEFLSVEHCRVRCMEDFDVALQLLRKGHDIATLAYWAHNQSQTQAAGGCSLFRTHEVHEESARKLRSLHPEFVSLRRKFNAGGGDFGVRTEVTVQWKKARASAD